MYDFSTFKQSLQKIVDHLKQDMSQLRTGKANVSILDPVKVEAYGNLMAIRELANVSCPDANLILVQPWDKNIMENIEKAILKSDLNLNPIVDKEQIRIVIPSLTQERREELVKQLAQKVESAKVMMRTARTEAKNKIEDQKGEAGVSEDDIHRDLEQMDRLMQDFEDKLEELEQAKKAELLQV